MVCESEGLNVERGKGPENSRKRETTGKDEGDQKEGRLLSGVPGNRYRGRLPTGSVSSFYSRL